MEKFDHLKQLRRFIIEGGRGSLFFQTNEGLTALHISNGYFLSSKTQDDEVVRAINMLVRKQVHNTLVKELQPGDGRHLVNSGPEALVIKACYHGEIEDARVLAIMHFFSLFPPVNIKLEPLNRHSAIFPDFPAYLKMHSDSILNGEIVLNDYLLNSSFPNEIRSTLRLILTLYLLGMIVPVPKPKNSIFERIIKRVRGL